MFFFFNDTATTEIYTLSLHDALPIYCAGSSLHVRWLASRRHRTPRRRSRQVPFSGKFCFPDQPCSFLLFRFIWIPSSDSVRSFVYFQGDSKVALWSGRAFVAWDTR